MLFFFLVLKVLVDDLVHEFLLVFADGQTVAVVVDEAVAGRALVNARTARAVVTDV